MLREWKTEWMKVRRRKIGLLVGAFVVLIFAWITWAIGDSSEEQIYDGWRVCFLQFALINTILLPTMIAMLASRLCDAEVKGNTLKLLCTMEKKGRLFDLKLLTGAVYLLLFIIAEYAMMFFLSAALGFGRPAETRHLVYFFLENYTSSILLLLLQQVLSFFYENQIIPLAAGLFGSFAGLFSWFLPGAPAWYLIPWGYYSELAYISYTWDEATRITTYYNAPFNFPGLLVLLAIIAAGYAAGRYLFVTRKEI